MMFNQVRFFSVPVPVFPDDDEYRAVTSLHFHDCPDCPEHIGQMVNSPFKYDFKGKKIEKYDKMYSRGT
jgi:hypothetical protein